MDGDLSVLTDSDADGVVVPSRDRQRNLPLDDPFQATIRRRFVIRYDASVPLLSCCVNYTEEVGLRSDCDAGDAAKHRRRIWSKKNNIQNRSIEKICRN